MQRGLVCPQCAGPCAEWVSSQSCSGYILKMGPHSSLCSRLAPRYWVSTQPTAVHLPDNKASQHFWRVFHSRCFLWASLVVQLVKNLPVNAGDTRDKGLILRSGRSPVEGNGNPLQYSCLEDSMDRGAWRAIVHGIRHDWAHTQLIYLHINPES